MVDGGSDDLFGIVCRAVIAAKREVVDLTEVHLRPDAVLAEPPISIDSLEFLAMILHLEEALGQVAEDTAFPPRSMRTVQDLVDETRRWLSRARHDRQ